MYTHKDKNFLPFPFLIKGELKYWDILNMSQEWLSTTLKHIPNVWHTLDKKVSDGHVNATYWHMNIKSPW